MDVHIFTFKRDEKFVLDASFATIELLVNITDAAEIAWEKERIKSR